MKKIIAVIFGIFGMFLLMLTAGGSDSNILPMWQIIVQAGISMVAIAIGLRLGGAFDGN